MVNLNGYYNSTYGFVSDNNLEDEANKLFGTNWEAEDDVNQINELIKSKDLFHDDVSVIEGKDEDDILVSSNDERLALNKIKVIINSINKVNLSSDNLLKLVDINALLNEVLRE